MPMLGFYILRAFCVGLESPTPFVVNGYKFRLPNLCNYFIIT